MKPSKFVMRLGLVWYAVYVLISAMLIDDFNVFVLCVFNGTLIPVFTICISAFIVYHDLDPQIERKIREVRKRRKK